MIVFALPAQAQETIRSFESLLRIEKDGTFFVAETIIVKAEGKKITHGITRDFPLLREDENGTRRKVDFELISVTRDHEPEEARIEDDGDHLRIHIGNKKATLEPRIYEYIIKYKTTGHMRYFEAHDEIIWNATGDFWEIPIERVLAQVVAPEYGAAINWDVFTGPEGSTEKDATIGKIAGKRVVKYRTTRVLEPGEGITVITQFPKGMVHQPEGEHQDFWPWAENKFVISIIGMAFLLILVGFILGTRVKPVT